MAERPVDVEPVGENVAGEAPVEEPEAATDDATVHDDDVELERTIGLVGGLAIGIGTMIGVLNHPTQLGKVQLHQLR